MNEPDNPPDPLSLHDVLTHLPDARYFDLRLEEELAVARRSGATLAVLTIDLDGLRHVNERFGQAAGDHVLRTIAGRLHHAVRRSDVVARVGADEFSILLPVATDQPEGAHLPVRVLEAIRRPITLKRCEPVNGEEVSRERVTTDATTTDATRSPLPACGSAAEQEIKLSASLGIALFPIDATDGPALRRASVTALHRAKRRGSNQFEFFSPRLNADALERFRLESDLQLAVASGAFELHYQPIVDGERRVSSLEALIRWPHAKRGFVSPAQFIPVAEKTGLIVEIGTWVLRECTRQAAMWARGGRAVRVACNVSPAQFLRPDFLATVTTALASSGLPGRRLEIELTEGLLMHETDEVVEKLRRLRALGVRVAIDDFGTGYSSLARLHRLPIDTLKIDRGFISEIFPPREKATRGESLRRRTAVVRSVVSLAKNLEVRLVAEGVEDERQFRFLRRIGYRALQGYLFSKPLPAVMVPATLDRLGLAHEPHVSRKVA